MHLLRIARLIIFYAQLREEERSFPRGQPRDRFSDFIQSFHALSKILRGECGLMPEDEEIAAPQFREAQGTAFAIAEFHLENIGCQRFDNRPDLTG